MVNLAPVIWLAIFASRSSRQRRVPPQVECALDRLELDSCIREADLACASLNPDDLTRDVILARKGLALALEGSYQEATLVLDSVRIDLLPQEERFRFFSGRIFAWLLASRTDAARDVVEVDLPRIDRTLVLPPLRERMRLAQAAFRAAEGEGATQRATLERVARRGWRPLHRVLAHIFVSRLDVEEGHTQAAIAHLEAAARLGPETVATSMHRSLKARQASSDGSRWQGDAGAVS